MKFPKKLKSKLSTRLENQALRTLGKPSNLVDFSSNDYLGFAKSVTIFDATHQFLVDKNIKLNGATGSRLLSGNHALYGEVETLLCDFHQSEATLIFNSGYDANVGFFSSVPQRGDVILYDESIHASIRDGIQLSNAKAYKFKHNNIDHLDEILKRVQHDNQEVYIVTESVFSMDGDLPDLQAISEICKKYGAHFIVDEAHAVGVFGQHGCGEVQRLGLEKGVFARIITFGKALGCHGAAILGSLELQSFLVNFARSFIYTTGLSPHALATIRSAYNVLLISETQGDEASPQQKLTKNIHYFRSEVARLALQERFIKSTSAIHCCVILGNQKVKEIAQKLQENGFDVKPILSPTVQKGEERLRFCLHAYNSRKEITDVLELLSTFVT